MFRCTVPRNARVAVRVIKPLFDNQTALPCRHSAGLLVGCVNGQTQRNDKGGLRPLRRFRACIFLCGYEQSCTLCRARACHSRSGRDTKRETLSRIAPPIASSRKPSVHEERKCVADGTRSSTAARSFSQTDCQDRQLRLESVCVCPAAVSRCRLAKDVLFLRVNHAAGAGVLPGVREGARSSDKVKTRDKR